jgi:hypothetical protein
MRDHSFLIAGLSAPKFAQARLVVERAEDTRVLTYIKSDENHLMRCSIAGGDRYLTKTGRQLAVTNA